jgi:hypothetical protein
MSLTIPDVQVTPPGDGTEYGCHLCGKKHPRITSMLDACLPKYALTPWAEKIGQKAMFDVLTDSPELSYDAARERIKTRGLTTEEAKNSGGDRGGAVHEYLEEYIATGDFGDTDFYGEAVKPYLLQLVRFLDDYEPEFLGSEFYLVHCELGYAGRCDGVCKIGKQPPRRNKPVDLTGKTVLFDLKTNALGRVYAPGHLYQTAGYRLAWDWLGGEELDHEIIVAVGEESYQVKVSTYSPQSFAPLAAFYHSMQAEKGR